MSRNTHPQKAHWSQGRDVVRKDRRITQTFHPPEEPSYTETMVFESIRRARRFMRVGGRWNA